MPYFEEQFLDDPDQLARFELAAIRKVAELGIRAPMTWSTSQSIDDGRRCGRFNCLSTRRRQALN